MITALINIKETLLDRRIPQKLYSWDTLQKVIFKKYNVTVDHETFDNNIWAVPEKRQALEDVVDSFNSQGLTFKLNSDTSSETNTQDKSSKSDMKTAAKRATQRALKK